VQSLGRVWLVGAGPGDPGLITVRGLEVLSRADVVFHDALAHPALLEACPNSEIVDVGKRYGADSPTQDAINAQLVAAARAGKRVVRLKGGDPFLFARGAEEAAALRAAGIPFEVVPGIASPVGASAYAGISLTHRDLSSSVTLITGSDRTGKEWSPEAWKKLATATDTICVLMGMRKIREIAAALVAGGRAAVTPVAVIQWGARPEQRVVTGTLADIADRVTAAGVANPALIVVGDVVGLRDQIAWFDSFPLFGKRVLVPRAAHQAEATARAIRERAAEPVLFPVIEIADPSDRAPLLSAAEALSSYDFVIFTSANGVERFFATLAELGRDARAFGSARLAVIGPKTAAALERRGLRADVVAEEFIGEGVGKAILEQGGAKRVLIPRAEVARDALPEMLKKAGAHVDVVAAYRTLPASAERARGLRELFETGGVDVALFTSGSTVSSLTALLGDDAASLLARVVVASIGPVTSRALAERGVTPAVTAEVYTVAGLLDALELHYSPSAERKTRR
jgi:uroporphyrinogen III methyltransferase / synthase